MPYLVGDTIHNNIYNGEYDEAFKKLLARLEKLENKCKNYEAYLDEQASYGYTGLTVDWDKVNQEQDQ